MKVEIRSISRKLDSFNYYLANIYLAMAFAEKKLTNKEAEILAWYMVAAEFLKYPFGVKGNKFVMEKAKVSRQGLSNYKRYIIGKGYIKKDEDGFYYIDQSIVPNKIAQAYKFLLVNNDKIKQQTKDKTIKN